MINLVLGIRALFLGLSVAITQAVYPLIPRFYKLFMDVANFRFLSNKFIYNIWNNIYVLVGVVVLFAIAIKLISAMVNPDTMTDNKKGVKGAYLRAVIAIILIFACPIIFNIAYDIQNDLLKDNFLITRIFGYKIDDKSAGQMLAWETFSAFCTPINSETKEAITNGNDFSSYYSDYYLTSVDIDNISNLDFELYYSTMALSTVGQAAGDVGAAAASFIPTGFEYHSLLCPLAGILVAYELFLLCMDTIFRSAKIAILQLMLPIVLGAYVFNPEILKKWAKEFFSTFIIVFLKVIAIGFMIIAINALKGVVF